MVKSINARLWLWILIIGLCSQTSAQQDYQAWLKQEQQKFADFKDVRDKAFCEYLQNEWRKMQVLQGILIDQTPKPIELPVAQPTTPVQLDTVPPLQLPPPPLPLPVESENLPPSPVLTGRPISFTFFGCSLLVTVDPSFDQMPGDVKPESGEIAAFWQQCSKMEYEPLLKQLSNFREKLALNDWGFYWLVQHFAQNLSPKTSNKCTLLVWFLLSKSGYDVRVGYDTGNIYLLLTTSVTLYNHSYFVLNEKKYFLCKETNQDKTVGSIYTYDSTYPGAEKPVDLRFQRTPQFTSTSREIHLRATVGDSTLSVLVHINPSLIEFYRNYPQSDLSVYFTSPLSPEILTELAQALRPRLSRSTENEALNLLLHFVQLAFAYQTDLQQFGREKPLFAEETLFYPASDCEDRSVLYAHLVHDLLGLEVVGLDYPGHVATAVRMQSQVPGDYVVIQGEKYLICDPTYMNARVGQSMPRYQHVQPGLVRL